jgi:HSP20 family protein
MRRMLPGLSSTTLHPVDQLRRQIDRIFEDAFAMSSKNTELEQVNRWYPSVDAYEEDDKFVVKAALPGVKKEDINIEVDENTLSISGESRYQNEVRQENLYKSEISYGKFVRSFSLGKNVDSERVKANFKDGILTVELPKKEDERAKLKKIKIS